MKAKSEDEQRKEVMAGRSTGRTATGVQYMAEMLREGKPVTIAGRIRTHVFDLLEAELGCKLIKEPQGRNGEVAAWLVSVDQNKD